MTQHKISGVGLKVISFFLIAGGAIGVALSIFGAAFILNKSVLSAFQSIFIFGGVAFFAIYQGLKIWQGKPESLKWGAILFAMQILSFAYAGASYTFHTLFKLALVINAFGATISTRFGTSLNAALNSPEPNYIGINIFAIFAFVYILVKIINFRKVAGK
ncbi:hypothetical protein [Cellvibrio sp. OA-2007]|uniref:hypothetical protein n=1 Tax=Cellvibrio sp. OA-2007 TaxID=529823 RepID=UPI0007841A49|nr:hypothetical protein [Cellvibrio sp. OA-2007]